jgi:hypothetical protein
MAKDTIPDQYEWVMRSREGKYTSESWDREQVRTSLIDLGLNWDEYNRPIRWKWLAEIITNAHHIE